MKTKNMRLNKFFMLLFNIMHIVIGGLVVLISIVYVREKKSNQLSSVSRAVIAFSITMSLFLIITAVIGCVGALKQHIRTLYVHIGFYLFLISIQILVSIVIIMMNALAEPSQDLRVSFFKNSTSVEDAKRQHAWDRLQIELYCCGVDGPQDYHIIHQDIPASCCITAYPLRDGGAKRQLHATCINDRTYFFRGCDESVKMRNSRDIRAVALTLTVMTFVELAIVVISLRIIRGTRSQRRQLQQNLQAHFET